MQCFYYFRTVKVTCSLERLKDKHQPRFWNGTDTVILGNGGGRERTVWQQDELLFAFKK